MVTGLRLHQHYTVRLMRITTNNIDSNNDPYPTICTFTIPSLVIQTYKIFVHYIGLTSCLLVIKCISATHASGLMRITRSPRTNTISVLLVSVSPCSSHTVSSASLNTILQWESYACNRPFIWRAPRNLTTTISSNWNLIKSSGSVLFMAS